MFFCAGLDEPVFTSTTTSSPSLLRSSRSMRPLMRSGAPLSVVPTLTRMSISTPTCSNWPRVFSSHRSRLSISVSHSRSAVSRCHTGTSSNPAYASYTNALAASLSAPRAIASANPCASVPRTIWIGVSASSTNRSSTDRNGQRSVDSIRDGDNCTDRRGFCKGSRVDAPRIPHQSSGSAPYTPARASRANWRAACSLRSGRSAGSHTTRRNSATIAVVDNNRRSCRPPGVPAMEVSCSSTRSASMPRSEHNSSRKREGSNASSASGASTAVTNREPVARDVAKRNRRRSSAKRSTDREMGMFGSMPSSSTSTSSSWPNNDPVSPSVGHVPSCTPATTTVCHSWPTAACAVNTRTASGRTPRRSREPVGNCCSAICRTKLSILAVGRRST